MNAKELAEKLDGREIGAEITTDEAEQAKAKGLAVVFGASDDLMEFRGAVDDEVDAYEGCTARINKAGIVQTPDCSLGADCKYFKASLKGVKEIKAVWCGDGKAPWSYETEIPHEEFNIFEDGELYCTGIVFSMEDVV